MLKWYTILIIAIFITSAPGFAGANSRLDALNAVHKAEMLYKSGKVNDAISVLQDEIKSNNQFAAAYIDLVQWFTEKGDVNKAINYGEAGMRATRGNSYIIMVLAHAYQVAGKPEKTIKLIQGLKEEYFSHKDILEKIADAYQSIGLTELSLSILKELENRYPDDSYIYNKLGVVYYKLGRKDLALESFSKAGKMHPDDPIILNNMGIIYSDIGDYNEAIAYFNRAILKNPDCAYCYLNLGVAYRFTNNYKNALLCYQKTININPEFKEAYYNLSILEQGYIHNYPYAIKYLKKYESMLPPDDKHRIGIKRRIMKLKMVAANSSQAETPAKPASPVSTSVTAPHDAAAAVTVTTTSSGLKKRKK